MRVRAIVTAPPYAPFLAEVAAHPLVCGLRLNTVMPLADPPAAVLARLAGLGPPFWVDLKGRQLRVAAAAIPPFTEVRLSHRIQVRTPAEAWFHDGRESARIVAVDGDRLILEDGPRRVVGPGESVNIPSASLEVEGTLTETDRIYLAAMGKVGLSRVMLSYAERVEDAAEVRELLPGVELRLKIESRRGLAFARVHGSAHGHLVAVAVAPTAVAVAPTAVAVAPTAVTVAPTTVAAAHTPGDDMKVGLAQINTRVGDFAGNKRRIMAAVEEARRQGGADLVVLPEMVVTGYPPRDLLLDPAFVERAVKTTAEIARELAEGPPVILGAVAPSGFATPGHPGLWNAAAVLKDGRVAALHPKRLLPAYDVFHEPRWFVPGAKSRPIGRIAGRRIGLLVCEDLWDEGYPVHPGADLLASGAETLIAISSSPFRSGVLEKRLHHARRQGAPVVFVNAAGANDELIFDGGSFVVDARGEVIASLPRFAEAVAVVELETGGSIAPELGIEEELFAALVLGVRDFAGKNGLARLFLGLSGGVDSALVACIAAEAVEPSRVTAVAIPSRHTDPRSTESARELATILGIGFEEIPLEPLHEEARRSLSHLLEGDPGTTDENLQARLRALILTAHVNRRGGLLLNTSNKTEISLGYGTLYGDLAGTLAVIGDLTKPQVCSVARWLAADRVAIPPFILERPPSAELKPDQVDPFDYPVVAPAVEVLVQGLPTGSEAERWRRSLLTSEHKRWQHGVVLKVSEKAFGTGRMVPVTRV